MSRPKAIIILTLVIAIAAVALSLDTCWEQVTTEVTKQVTISTTPGETIENQRLDVDIGQQFELSLEANATTGFEWQEEHDENYVKLLGDEYIASQDRENGIAGTGGTHVFKYKALKEGQTEITLTYRQPWEVGDKGTTVVLIVTAK